MIYEFYWSWYEEYTPWLFEHDSKTQEEFEDDCKKIMLESFDEYMTSRGEYDWAGVSDWMEFSLDRFANYGYAKVKPIAWGLFGGFIVKDENNKEVLKDFPKEIFNKMVKWNKSLEASTDKGVK